MTPAHDERAVARNRMLRRAIGASISARAITTGALLVLTPVLTRAMGAQGYGVLMTLTSAATVLGLAGLGVSNGLISRLAATEWPSKQSQKILSSAVALLVSMSITAIALAALATAALPWPKWLNAPEISETELRWATFFALLGIAFTLTTNLGQKVELARQRGHAVAKWSSISALAGPAAATVAAVIGMGIVPIVAAASLLPPLVLAAQTIKVLRSSPPSLRPKVAFVDSAEIRVALRSGGPYFGLAVVISASFQIDLLIVSSILGAAVAAQFSVVIRMFGLISGTVESALSQLWSAFAEALAGGDVRWAKATFWRSTAGVTAVAMAASVPLILFGQEFVAAWAGSALRPSNGLLLAAAAWTIYRSAIVPLSMFLNGANLQMAQLAAAIPMAIVNVGLSIMLTHRLGSPGPLLGSLISHILCAGIPLAIFAYRWLRSKNLTIHPIPS